MNPNHLQPLRLALALIVLAACCSEAPKSEADRPDVVLVVIDTLRADHLGIYGHRRPTSPHLDALAGNGAWYRRAYAQSGWTLPAMASLLTGLLPHQHRVGRDPIDTERFGSLPDQATTLAEHLGDAGYRCGAIVNNTFLAPGFGLHQGFEDYDYQGASNEEHRSAEESVDRALAWLADDDARPSFLMLHLMEPHLNYSPPESVRGHFTGHGPPPVELPFTKPETILALRNGDVQLTPEQLEYVTGLYDEEILAADRAVGRLVDELARTPRWGQTVIVVTSDHGEEFFDHGKFEHGHTLYGELVRIPLITHGPGLPRGEINAPVQHLDLFAGLLGLAGIAPPHPGMTDLFTATDLDAPRLLIAENTLAGPPLVSVMDGEHKVIVNQVNGDTELWRLDADGLDRERRKGPTATPDRRRLRQQLAAQRGSLDPVLAAEGVSMPDYEAFEQLKSLGYVK